MSADGKFILVQEQKRVEGAGPFDTREQAEAEREARERKQLSETKGKQAPSPIAVKQNIYG